MGVFHFVHQYFQNMDIHISTQVSITGPESVKQLQADLPIEPIEGKMYGILIVERNGEVGYLQAYSGQIADEGEDFVPAVFRKRYARNYETGKNTRLTAKSVF